MNLQRQLQVFPNAVAAAILLMMLGASCTQDGLGGNSRSEGAFEDTFAVDKANLVSRGDNRYFPLQPGHRASFAHDDETLVITVLNETKRVDGVETRVVEERESRGGRLVEVSRNFFAIDRSTGDVYYFGEEVDMYRDGQVVSHEGAWLSGVNGAKFGLIMPGNPKEGRRYYQEQAPGIAMDRVRIVSLREAQQTPAGTFRDCLKTEESSAIESGRGEKVYAPGIGLIRDDELLLVVIQTPPAAP